MGTRSTSFSLFAEKIYALTQSEKSGNIYLFQTAVISPETVIFAYQYHQADFYVIGAALFSNEQLVSRFS
jgi:hypothetical protein